MMYKTFFILLLISFYRCGDEENPQEKISKLRAVGVDFDPVILSDKDHIGKTINATFILAMPEGTTITNSDFSDEANKFEVMPLTEVEQSDEEIYQQIGPLRLAQVKFTGVIPQVMVNPFIGLTKVAYARRFEAENEQEDVIGSLIIFSSEKEQTSWTPHTVEILEPAADAQLANSEEIPIVAYIKGKNDEPYKVGWFTSTGNIKNRRAIKTSLIEPDSGAQTLIVTVRGLSTGAFAWKAISITLK